MQSPLDTYQSIVLTTEKNAWKPVHEDRIFSYICMIIFLYKPEMVH